MKKIMKEKLTYCFISYNSNQPPKLLCDNKDTAAVFFNYFQAKKKKIAQETEIMMQVQIHEIHHMFI